MVEEFKQHQPIRSTLLGLEIGERVFFPASQLTSLRTSATNYGFELGRRFSVTKDRENKNHQSLR